MVKLILMFLLIAISIGSTDQARAADDMTPVFKTNTHIKNPLELRDPFKRKLNKLKKKNRVSALDGLTVNRDDEILQNLSLEQIRVVGVIVGPERRAIIKVEQNPERDSQSSGARENDNRATIFVKEGTRIGSDDAEVKAILPGGIVIVNKIKNVYDQDEYLETVIPITEE